MEAMRNAVLTILALTLSSPGAFGQGTAWADKMFNGATTHDFGSVPRGAQLYHRFPMTNIWRVPLEIINVRTSCGCVTATPSTQVLQPRETGYVDITMDGRRFTGPKTVSVYVQVGPQYTSTATLQVSATSRADVVFNPGEVNFGVVSQGQSPTQVVDVEYAGALDWNVVEIVKNGAPFDVALEELYRRPGQVGYRVRVTLKPDAPSGTLRQELVLKTNDPTSPLVPVLVEATLQASLTIVPGTVNLGTLKVGEKAVRRVVVRGNQPFKIVGVEGLGEGLDAELPPATAPVQIVTVKYAPDQPGELHRQLRIRTDLDRQSTATVTVEGSVTPQ
jgi:hypothetical protein